MKDEEVMTASKPQLIAAAHSGPDVTGMSSGYVNRISKGMSLRRSYYILPAEATTMRAVARDTRINVPTVHRFFTEYDDDGNCGPYKSIGYLVMDYVDGMLLSDCWRELQDKQREEIVKQVVDMIQQLRQLKFPEPGPLRRGPSRGVWFCEHGAGPFTDTVDFNGFFNRKLDYLKRQLRVPAHVSGYDFQEFVLTHQNITPKNIIIDRQDQLWLVNWGNAGAYPPIFELGALQTQKLHPDFSYLVLEAIEYDRRELYHLMRLSTVMRRVDEEEVCFCAFGLLC
jgi:aminoglycoside phosphotransferase (APT) family kinase protein